MSSSPSADGRAVATAIATVGRFFAYKKWVFF